MRAATKVMIVGSGHRRERAVHPQSYHSARATWLAAIERQKKSLRPCGRWGIKS
jgi:hypothetical protein